MSKCVLYMRRSTDLQTQSLDDQRETLEAYALKHGYEIVGSYVDDAVSGAKSADRHQFSAMMDDAQAKGCRWGTILVYDVSRFGRQCTDEAGYYRHLLTQAGVDVSYVADGLHGGDDDDLLRANKQWSANNYVKELSKVTIRGQVSHAKKGRWCGGRPPYGYDLCYMHGDGSPYQVVRYLPFGEREIRSGDGTDLVRSVERGERLTKAAGDYAVLVPGLPARVSIVQRIYGLYVDDGMGLGSIASVLNAEGVPSPGQPRKGANTLAKWSVSTVRELIRNPVYRGASVWNRRSFSQFNKVKSGVAQPKQKVRRQKKESNSKEDWIENEGSHEALVSFDLWHCAQQAMNSRGGSMSAEQQRTAKSNSPYVLSGLITCAKCGAKWQGKKTTKGRKKPGTKQSVTYSYRCGGYTRSGNTVCSGRSVGKVELETAVLEHAQAHLGNFLNSGGAAMLADYVVASGTVSTSEEAALSMQLKSDRQQVETWVASITPVSTAILVPRINTLEKHIEETEARIAALAEFRVTQHEAMEWAQGILINPDALGELIAAATATEQRTILRGVTQEIVFDTETRTGQVTFSSLPEVCEED